MEALAIESFSRSWLLNARRPSLDCLADSESLHQEQDITFAVHSMRFLEADEAKNFRFDITADDSESALVHADDIFSDGHIMPLYLDRPKAVEEALQQAFNTSSSSSSVSAPATPANNSFSLSVRGKKDHHQDYIIQKWKKLHSRILHKWFGFLRPLCKRLGSSRKSTAKVDDLNRKTKEVQSWSNSLHASPRRICKASSGDDLRKTKSCCNTPQESPLHSPYHSTTDVWRDMADSSITEAIIHCKKSFGMLDST